MKKLLIGVMIVFTAIGCGSRKEAQDKSAEAPAVEAAVQPVQLSSLGAQYQAVGTVTSMVTSTIQSKAVGHIIGINFKEGDIVEAGAALVELDAREVDAMLQKAQSGVTESQRALEETEQSAMAAESTKKAAEAQLALAKSTYDRYNNLAQSQAISKQILDEASAKLKAATAEVSRATETVNAYSSKKAEIAARMEQAKAELDNAQVQVSHTKITAPFAGIITAKYVDVGDLASPGVPLLAIEDHKRYRLEAVVDEARAGLFQPGQKVAVVIDALGTEPVEGIVAEVVPKADPSSRSMIVKVNLPENGKLHSGTFGRVTFSSGNQEMLTVPQSAVFQRGQLTCVYVLDPQQQARLRLVKAGKKFDHLIEVLSGLNQGEVVVVDQLDKVSDGARIQPTAAQ